MIQLVANIVCKRNVGGRQTRLAVFTWKSFLQFYHGRFGSRLQRTWIFDQGHFCEQDFQFCAEQVSFETFGFRFLVGQKCDRTVFGVVQHFERFVDLVLLQVDFSKHQRCFHRFFADNAAFDCVQTCLQGACGIGSYLVRFGDLFVFA